MINKFLATAIVLFATATLQAQEPAAPLLVEGVDITPVAEYLEREVQTIQEPRTFYSWSNAAYLYEGGNKLIAASGASTFWKMFGHPTNTNNMYGAGLYLAADPIISDSYGTTSDWLLMEVQLPKGFRYVDVSSMRIPIPSEARSEYLKIIAQFDCAESLSTEDVFGGGGTRLKPKCQSLMRVIYKDILRIDGFAYMYGRYPYKTCSTNPEGTRAFVVTNPYWMDKNSVRYYTAKSKGDDANRIRIQSLFLTLEPANPIGDEPPMNSPVIINEEAKLSVRKRLLWPDLEGKPKTAAIETWMKKNLFYCSGKP